MGVKPLFALFYAPNMDAVSGKPLYYKGGFVGDAPDPVEHEHQQNIKLIVQRPRFDDLNDVPLFGSDFMSGDTVLLFFKNDGPSLLLTEPMAGDSLHGDIRFIVAVIVHLLFCRYTVQAADTSAGSGFRKC